MGLIKDLKNVSSEGFDDIKSKFNLRLIGGEITVENLQKFNSMRHTLIIQNPEWVKYLDKKGWVIRMLINVFLEYPSIIMELAEKTENGAKDGK